MNEEFKKFIQKEVGKLHKITLLEEAKKQIIKELILLKENEYIDPSLVEYEIPFNKRVRAESYFVEETKDINVIDQKENLEYFLSFNNDDIYWKWINEEIDDNGAITIMRDIEGLKYDPTIDYKEKYS
jgi:hypothetical protein